MRDEDAYGRLHDGTLYNAVDAELMEAQRECLEKLEEYNATRARETRRRADMLRQMLAEVGEEEGRKNEVPVGKRGRKTTVRGRANAKYEVRSTKYEVLKFGATELRR